MPERPTGTVTFLFPDIEGSTRLLQQLRDRYGEVLSDSGRSTHMVDAWKRYGRGAAAYESMFGR